jgi:hypothetical protein
MEILDKDVIRVKLIFGQFPVMEVHEWTTGYEIKVQFGPTTFTAFCSLGIIDIRPGDLMTLYTEVPLKKGLQNAPALPPPIQ